MKRPTLKTPLCDFFGIEYPIVLAGMGGIVSPSGPELTAAVCEAGGLGVLGGAFVSPDDLAAQIERTRQLTSKPFGVDTLIPFSVTRGALEQPAALEATLPAEHLAFIEEFARRHDLGDLPEAQIPIYDPPDPRPWSEIRPGSIVGNSSPWGAPPAVRASLLHISFSSPVPSWRRRPHATLEPSRRACKEPTGGLPAR